jgi:hypothetical protein
MGGQACVWYGAAEFSRDIDIAILADTQTLDGLRKAIVDLDAVQIAVPPFEAQYLHRGLGVHFRCQHEDVRGLRLDVMERMRGVATFEELWSRRTEAQFENSQTVNILALPDLVAAKKTQRDKDWPMIRRLIEVNYLKNRDAPSPAHLDFWFREARSEFILLELASKHEAECRDATTVRPLLRYAVAGDQASLVKSLMEEQQTEMEADRAYWKPLRGELEGIRHSLRGK